MTPPCLYPLLFLTQPIFADRVAGADVRESGGQRQGAGVRRAAAGLHRSAAEAGVRGHAEPDGQDQRGLRAKDLGDEARETVFGEQAQGHHGSHPSGAAQHDRAGEGDDGQAAGHYTVPDAAQQSRPSSWPGADLRHGPGCALQRTAGAEGIRVQAQSEAEREQGIHALPDARPGDAGGGDQHQGEHLQDRRGRLHDPATGPEVPNILVGQHYIQYSTSPVVATQPSHQ